MITVHRVAGRLTHLPSGRVYNLDFNPPKNPVSKTKTLLLNHLKIICIFILIF